MLRLATQTQMHAGHLLMPQVTAADFTGRREAISAAVPRGGEAEGRAMHMQALSKQRHDAVHASVLQVAYCITHKRHCRR